MGKINQELGRKKLMMRFPELRGQLRNASGDTIEELFVAYQLAVSTRDRIRAQRGAHLPWHAEYDVLFAELEQEVKTAVRFAQRKVVR